MPLRKIGDLPPFCLDPEHDPPKNIALDPGIYEHQCPTCRAVQTFTVKATRVESTRGWSIENAQGVLKLRGQ